MNTNPNRTLQSLKATPTYKPLPRRQNAGPVQAPWLSSSTHTNQTATTTASITPQQPQQPQSTITASTTAKPEQQPPPPQSTIFESNVDNNLDEDEFFDPFAATNAAKKNKGQKNPNLLGDDYNDSDNDDNSSDDSDDDDEDDEEAELRRALKQIQEEREKEKQLLAVKSEHFGNNLNQSREQSMDQRLLSNPLMAGKMVNLVKVEQSIKDEYNVSSHGDVKLEDGNDNTGPSGPVKRKKWTSDSLFSNTALKLGDSHNDQNNKKQRLNNDTINSDKHKEFMSSIFK